MSFTKMQGCGNDYVYVDCIKQKIDNPSEMAVKISDRHFGIGSDGLILIESSVRADFRMRMFNADGSEGSMCGNGIRCVAKYVYDKGLTDKKIITIDTKAGIKYLELYIADNKVDSVKVDMGSPVLKAELIPVISSQDTVINELITAGGTDYRMTCISMGNPHAVVFVEDTDALDLERIGPGFEHHERFPDRVNTEFVRVIDRRNIAMRVWERGSGETLACGTGACASVAASVMNGYTDEEVTVHLEGGELIIHYDQEENHIYMTGKAVTVYEGVMELI